jgi:hypothetical protein
MQYALSMPHPTKNPLVLSLERARRREWWRDRLPVIAIVASAIVALMFAVWAEL